MTFTRYISLNERNDRGFYIGLIVPVAENYAGSMLDCALI